MAFPISSKVMLEAISKPLHQRPLLTASLAALGTLWVSTKLIRLASFTHIHFLRRPSLTKYQPRTKNTSQSDTWALVTGASDGIGRGFAEELCRRGFNVILHGRNEEKLQRVKRELLKEWPDRPIRIFVFDATGNIAELERLAVEQLNGLKITILINNIAAGQRPFWIPLASNTAQRVGLSVDVDARFTVEITRILLPQLIKQSTALVLNVGSLASEAPCPYASVLSGTKAFGKAWSRSLNLEMRSEGHDVEVIHILVGLVATPNENRTVSLTVPDPRIMARASLDKAGCGKDSVVGYWAHGFMSFVITDLPAWVTERMITSIAKQEREIEQKMLKAN